METQHSGNVEHGSRRATYDDKMSDERSTGLGSADPSDATCVSAGGENMPRV